MMPIRHRFRLKYDLILFENHSTEYGGQDGNSPEDLSEDTDQGRYGQVTDDQVF